MKLYKVFLGLGRRGLLDWLPDKAYLNLVYLVRFKERIDFCHPKTFNEKLQWLKIFDRKKRYVTMVDKYNVKEFVANILGEKYIIPTIKIYNNTSEIDFDELPEQFVAKCTHDSGSVIVVDNKSTISFCDFKKKLSKALKHNGYNYGREWPYKNVKPRILIEKYMVDATTKELRDYKFFCFNGEVKFFKVDFNRFTKHQANYYNKNLKLLEFGEEVCPPDFKKKIIMPKTIKQMIKLAEKLSKGIPFIRVDFYDVNGKIYFGELTFFPASGFGKFIPEEWDAKIGEMLNLPTKEDAK